MFEITKTRFLVPISEDSILRISCFELQTCLSWNCFSAVVPLVQTGLPQEPIWHRRFLSGNRTNPCPPRAEVKAGGTLPIMTAAALPSSQMGVASELL